MRLGKFSHAMIKGAAGEPEVIAVDLDLLAAWYYSTNSKCTHLVMTAGAMLPVLEPIEYVTQLKQGKRRKRE